MGGRLKLVCLAACTLALGATPALAAPRDTTVRTIQDRDDDNLLEYAPGEDYTVFGTEDESFRPPRRGSLLNFLQLSDFQIVDEESPGRVEFLDTTQRFPGLNPFSAAYRPQESLTTQITEAMVRQARNTASPLTGEQLDLTILTGDNADSQQYNETRWFIDILDGTTGSEDPDPEMHADVTNDRKIVPDSGVESGVQGCNMRGFQPRDNDSVYDGVRGGGRAGGGDTGYYEPDASSGNRDDGDGYYPDRARNREEIPDPTGTFGDVTVRDFPGLLEDAQDPFEAHGLDMPWFSAFGNHDALVQGNSSDAYLGPVGPGGSEGTTTEMVNRFFDAIVRGCVKPRQLPEGLSAEAVQRLRERAVADPVGLLTDPSFLADANAFVVPPDERRCHLAKDIPNDAALPCLTGGWIQQHKRTTGLPVGHGFERFLGEGQAGDGRPPEARANHDGYYSFRPRPGLRFIVFDTITDECGVPVCSEGSVDDAQFKWMEREIDAASNEDEYVLLFSHHTERTTRLDSADPTESDDPDHPVGEGPPPTFRVHYGERVDRRSGRLVRPDAVQGSTLEDLFCRHSNVLAHVGGHEHENYVLRHGCEDLGQGTNAFYEISTAAHIDFPQQSRMIELIDNGDRTMSLALTIIDHDGVANPGGPPPPREGQGSSGDSVQRLASIGREIAYNDYQGSRGAGGSRGDRNVIIKLSKPFPFGSP